METAAGTTIIALSQPDHMMVYYFMTEMPNTPLTAMYNLIDRADIV
jgi:hypothetical protein